MSDSIVIPITTSPPQTNTSRGIAAAKPADCSFEDVLRAQTDVQEPKANPIGQQNKTQSSPQPAQEAAKSDQPKDQLSTKVEEKDKPEDKEPEKSNDQMDATAQIACVNTPVQPVDQPQTPALTDEVADLTAQAAAAPVPPVLPETASPVAAVATTQNPAMAQSTDADQPQNADQQTFAQQVQAAAKPAETASQQPVEKTADARPSTPVIPLNQPAEADQKPVAQVADQIQSAKAGDDQTAVKAQVTQTPAAKTTAKTTSTVAKAEVTAAKVEEAEPKQVQAPPGAPPAEAAGSAVKTTATVPANQFTEPARLAEAQTSNIIGQITRQMDGLAQSGKTTFRLQLSPQDLGQIDLKITSTQQGIGVTILAENAATGKLLETQVAQLRQSLLDAGVQISNLQIGTQAGQQQSAGSQLPYQKPNFNSYSGTSQLGSDEADLPEIRSRSSLVDYKV
jgi:flagellar hook-length control protein FliK